MGNRSVWVSQLREFFWSDPLMAVAIGAALVAFATTPLAFAVLGRVDWFKARRGRTLQKPEFWSVVCGMVLVMAIPAIFSALVLKSRYFDKNRYEFDPNRTISVLDQGRQFESLRFSESLYKADEAVRAEMKRLAEERKNLADGVKKLDEAMLTLRAASSQSPATAQAVPSVLERLARVRKAVGLDAPQQLMDFTAPPAALASLPATAASPSVAAPAPAPPPATSPGSLSEAEAGTELATVPDPQRPLAAMLPLTNLPAGWVVAKSGDKHLETFNAENLYEKIDGRAESFTQYGVRGMAYTYYHPAGDESSEAQVYIFEMADPLKAYGKYGSEKPDDAKLVPVGTEGYSASGSILFYAGKFYTQVVTTKDDPKVAAFALVIAKRVAEKQLPSKSAESVAGTSGAPGAASPTEVFKLLPPGPKKAGEKYVAQDAFGYSFLSDVFMADYQDGEVTWQGFLRPYASPEEARQVFEKYVATAKQDGAQIKEIEDSAAERMLVSSNIGLVDAVFLKGNTLAGANGATNAAKAEAFARELAKTLPAKVPVIEQKGEGTAEPEGDH
jgi:hypothetical protein